MKRHLTNILLIFLLLLSGCAISKGAKQTPDEIARNQASTILECIISKDSDKLRSLLIPSMQESFETDEQIENFLKFIDGSVISHSEPKGSLSSSKKRSGKIVQELLTGWTSEIETDSGNRYQIHHFAIGISTESPDEIGVYCVTIVNLNLYDPEYGYPESARATIGGKLVV